MRIGTAGWGLTQAVEGAFPGPGSHLQRYARTLPCVEINSSFHRRHQRTTYRRWAESTPNDFAFAAKVPRAITHVARLDRAELLLEEFIGDVSELGPRLRVLLVQLPPSLAFDTGVAGKFFVHLRRIFPGAIVCEPRHESWFTPSADHRLSELQIGRAAVDPARFAGAAHPGGWLGPGGDGRGAVVYYRWHGSPRTYWSLYDTPWLRERADEVLKWPVGADCWCVFDNTAGGRAIQNAIELRALAAISSSPEDPST